MRRTKKARIISAIIIVVLIAAMLLTIIAAAAPVAQAASKQEEVVGDGISIEGTDVSGMTAAEAQQVVDAYIAQFADRKFTLVTDDGEVTATAADLGLRARNQDAAERAVSYGSTGNLLERFAACHRGDSDSRDIQISLTVDPATASAYLKSQASALEKPAVNNGLNHDGGQFTFVNGTEGTAVDISRSVTKIADFLTSGWDRASDATIELVTYTVEPEGTEEELSAVQDRLGTFTTDFSGSASGRITNIKRGTSLLNGHILYPGEELSVHSTVSPIDAEHGWALAGAYENGATVEDYGGGLCQVSTTLYNAVIRAELEVVERSPHSMVVNYVKPSMDAAIAGTTKDFVFRNNQDYPVYIEGYVSGSTVTFSIYGKETRDADRSVSFESEIVSQTDPGTEYTTSDEYPAGSYQRTQKSHTGYEARLWKIVTVNGQETSRDIFNRSKYRASNTVYTVGTQGMPAEGVSAVKAAIATGDENTIKSTAAQWTASAVAARTAAAQAAAAQTASQQAQEAETQTQADTASETVQAAQ